MKPTTILALMLLAALPVLAEEASRSPLRPCEDLLESGGIDYWKRLAAVLFEPVTPDDDPADSIRAVVAESWKREWAIVVRAEDLVCEYREAERQVLEANFTTDPDEKPVLGGYWRREPAEVPVSVSSAPLSADTVIALENVWQEAFERIEDRENYGLDGTTYRFYLHPPGSCMETWSPDDGTLAKRLVTLVTGLRDFVRTEDPDERVRREEKLRRDAEGLLRALRRQDAP